MKVSFDRDLKTVIYDLGVDAVFNGNSIRVIFNSAGDLLEMGGAVVEYDADNCLCAPEDVADAKNGDVITIQGKDYYIMSIKRSANGETVLTLSEETLNG